MAFTIKMQAFLTDRYYHYLKEKYPEQAIDALTTAFNYYAIQRGRRAAQRAIRDKAPLNFENYQKYREVVSTDAMKAIDGAGRSHKILNEKEYVGFTFECPNGHGAFRELNSPVEAELVFCRHIDKCNVYGFSSDIPYEVVSTFCDSPLCIHRSPNPGCRPDTNLAERMPDAPPYPFIVANEYFSMREILVAIFDEGGEEIAKAVKQDFISHYGPDDWDEICKYKDANFNIMYPKYMK